MWAGCVHWFGQICTFKKRDLGKWECEVQICQKSASFMRPRRICCPSTAPCLAKPGHGINPAPVADCRLCAPGTSAAPALPVRTAPAPVADCRLCAPGTSAAPALQVRTACPPHPVLPDHSPRRPTHKPHPQNLAPQNSETPRPPNGRRSVNTQRGVSARRLTRQLRKSPRPQRRHLRCRLLARPLRERQRPQEQQR